MSLEIFRDSLVSCQRVVNDAKRKHLSNLKCSNSHSPGILFSNINSVINPVSVALADVSEHTCNTFRQYFFDKLTSVRQSITKAPTDDTSIPAVQFIFDKFAPVSLVDFMSVVQGLKATSCHLDTVLA